MRTRLSELRVPIEDVRRARLREHDRVLEGAPAFGIRTRLEQQRRRVVAAPHMGDPRGRQARPGRLSVAGTAVDAPLIAAVP
jgi:hypothetical protein